MLNALAQRIYNGYIAALRERPGEHSRRWRNLRKMRRLLLKLGDPDVIAMVDGFQFKTPFSSNILLSHFEFPFYDTTLPRLAAAVAREHGDLRMLDIGANVGASTYLVSRETPGSFFCVEANPRFKESLSHNLGQIPRSTAKFVALTDEKKTAFVRHDYAEGNSSIEPAQAGDKLEFVRLDELLRMEPSHQNPNLIKIDTEGFEFKILRGGAETIEKSKPALFFEYFPDFIQKQGDAPQELFTFLQQMGYNEAILYDGGGHLLTTVSLAESEKLHSFRRYCQLRHSFFDVAAFHEREKKLFAQFVASETAFFDQRLGAPNS